MRLDALKRGVSQFNKATSLSAKILVVAFLWIVGWVLFDLALESYDNYKANHRTAAENLRTAQNLCPKSGTMTFACYGSDQDRSISYLEKISPDAPQHGEGSKMLSDLREWQRTLELAAEKAQARNQLALAQKKAEHDRLANQSEQESKEQMQRNFAGMAHDSFTCSTSTTNTPIISFDCGHYWWVDDGRCAAEQEKEREAKERVQQQQREEEQKQ